MWQKVYKLICVTMRKLQKKDLCQYQFFADLKDVVKITTSAKTPDPEQLRRINEVIDRLVKDHGYTVESANELLSYVGTLLSR
jgi:serine protein kinase